VTVLVRMEESGVITSTAYARWYRDGIKVLKLILLSVTWGFWTVTS